MGKIKDTVLSPELNERLVGVIEKLPDVVVTEFGRVCMPGGFTRAQPVRARCSDMLRSNNLVPAWLMKLLRENTPGVQAMRVLSIEGLKALVDTFILLKGRDSTALPLLVDEREEAYRLGAEVLARKQHVCLRADHPRATRALLQFIDQHLLCVADTTLTPAGELAPTEHRSPPPENYDPQELVQLLDEMTKRLREEGTKAERLEQTLQEQARQHAEATSKAAQQAFEDSRRLRAQRDEAREKLQQLAKQHAAVNARLEELQAAIQSEVSRGMEQQTSALVRKWLAAPAEDERQLQELNATSSDVFARAEAALGAQARHDRAAGTRVELEGKLAQLRDLHARLTRAAQTALRPLPELHTALAAVEEALRRTERMLGNGQTEPMAEKFLVAINRAGTWSEAQKKSDLVQQLLDAELLPGRDCRRLFDALHRKFSLLAETTKPSEADNADHGWSLRQVLYRNQPSFILLDGHNILFRLDDVFRPHCSPDGHPGKQAREHLIALTGKLIEGRCNLRVRICFDAPQHSKLTVCPNLEVEYSGGQGEHRADARIRESVAWRRPDELDQKWYVVTNDRAVRRHAVSNGARYVPVDVFAVLLADFRCLDPASEIVTANSGA